jgi:hypothetical protein
LQLVDESLSRAGEVRVSIDDRRHDGLASEIHAGGPRRNLQLTGSADLDETGAVDDERGVLEGRAAFAVNQPRPFEHRQDCWLARRGCRTRRDEQDANRKQTNDQDPPA